MGILATVQVKLILTAFALYRASHIISTGIRFVSAAAGPFLLLEGEGVGDKDNSIRLLARGFNEPRRCELSVPGSRVVQGSFRLYAEGTS